MLTRELIGLTLFAAGIGPTFTTKRWLPAQNTSLLDRISRQQAACHPSYFVEQDPRVGGSKMGTNGETK